MSNTGKFVILAIDMVGLEEEDYKTLYGQCPAQFINRAEAERWAAKLNAVVWPAGQSNPGYEVFEL